MPPKAKDDPKKAAAPVTPTPTPAPTGPAAAGKPEVKLDSAVKPKKGSKEKGASKKEQEKDKKKPSVLENTVGGSGSYMQDMMEIMKLGEKLADEMKDLAKATPGAIARAPGAIKDKVKNLSNMVENAVDYLKEKLTPGSKDDQKSSKQNNPTSATPPAPSQQNSQTPAATMSPVPDSPTPAAALSQADTAAFDNKLGAGAGSSTPRNGEDELTVGQDGERPDDRVEPS